MITVKADNRRRVQLPSIKPGQVFAFEVVGDGSFLLRMVAPVPRERPFDPELYADLDGDRLALERKLSEASAVVDMSAEERDRK
jgi:hypothetical protein